MSSGIPKRISHKHKKQAAKKNKGTIREQVRDLEVKYMNSEIKIPVEVLNRHG